MDDWFGFGALNCVFGSESDLLEVPYDILVSPAFVGNQ